MYAEGSFFQTSKTLRIGGRLIDLSTPAVMGIINVTPDSFYQQSRFESEANIIEQAHRIIEEGGTFIDIGGYSSRPGADHISEEEERSRTIPAIQSIIREFPEALISVDTFRASIAREAVQAGATMINDISGGNLDEGMWATVRELNVPYIIMHMRGTPQDMQSRTDYDDLVQELLQYLGARVRQLHEAGIADVIIDPGFGFAKTIEQNYELLKQLHYFKITGVPVLAGLSRKSMIWKTLESSAEEALNGTTVLNTLALEKGADILRVHDVQEAVETVKLVEKAT